MPRELRRGSGEILRKTKLRDVRTLSVLNKFIIGMSDCKEKNAKKPHKFICKSKCNPAIAFSLTNLSVAFTRTNAGVGFITR